jgi:RES domain-containing protein
MTVLPLKQKIQDVLLSAISFDAVCFRVTDTARASAGQSLSTEGSRIHGGRYNPVNEFGVFYLSCDLPTCLAEVNYYLSQDTGIELADLEPGIKTMVEVGVRLVKVLDLTNSEVQDALGVNEADLTAEWEGIQAAGGESLTQSIGRFAREAGFEALLVPSARHQGYNLVIVNPDNLSAESRVQEIKQELLHFNN